MIKKITKTLALSFLLIGVFACGSDSEGPDTEAPVITVKTPESGQEFKRSTSLPLKATITDNRGVKECIVTIEYTEEASQASVAQLKGIGTPWTPAKSEKYNQSGEEHKISFSGEKKTEEVDVDQLFGEIIEASCLSGTYTLSIIASDNAEKPNTTAPVEIDIEIIG